MRAIVYSEYGSPDVLRLEEVEKPVPKEDEVLVRVCATSVNDWDWALIYGETTNRLLHGITKPKLRILGGDVAGRVEAVGAKVSAFGPGDEVYGDLCMAGFGTFAEYVCAPAQALINKPAGMTFEQAAAIPQAGMLAVQGLIDVGEIGSGKNRVLLNGAGGGVGTFALQLAKTYGVEVTCVDSAEKLDMLSELGADHVIDYRQVDFTRDGQRYDLILDPKSTRSPYDYARALAPEGIYVTVGGQSWRLFQAFVLGRLISKTHNKHIRVVALKPNKDLAFVNAQFEAGHLVPIIDGPYKLEDTAKALHRFASAQHLGKIVITVD
jgi:NADPH:quinone reductase-like Zn-dependent oxidoreductase